MNFQVLSENLIEVSQHIHKHSLTHTAYVIFLLMATVLTTWIEFRVLHKNFIRSHRDNILGYSPNAVWEYKCVCVFTLLNDARQLD